MICVEILDSWNLLLEKFSRAQKDIYFTEEYVKLSAGKNQTPLCAVCREDQNVMLFPFLRSSFDRFYDFETPYGYGGPVSNCPDADWNKKAVEKLKEFFSDNDYLAGFIRFHPLLRNSDMCRTCFTVIDDRKTVAIDTSVSVDEIWQNQINSKNRNMIRKAEKNGLVYVRDNDFKYLDQFKKLYDSTMKRLEADDFYFFDDDYYARFTESFHGKGFLGCIRNGDEVISAALFMYDGDYGHYHLAGSCREYSSLGANNLLLWKTACEMHGDGIREFHLGGGTDSQEENSLFKFKKSFSPELRQFSIGKVVFNKEAYDAVCAGWERKNPEKTLKYKNLVLKYRY